jgi:hypothetical protein
VSTCCRLTFISNYYILESPTKIKDIDNNFWWAEYLNEVIAANKGKSADRECLKVVIVPMGCQPSASDFRQKEQAIRATCFLDLVFELSIVVKQNRTGGSGPDSRRVKPLSVFVAENSQR